MNKSYTIFLAAGIFYPDVGGPAIHVRKIADRLIQEGFSVTVLAYGDDPSNTQFAFRVKRISRRLPKIVQWLLYSIHTAYFTAFSDLVYTFDPTAAGVAALVSAKIFSKPCIVRIGGDPIWEREAEAGRIFMSMDQYYKEGLYKKDKPVLFKIIKTMLRFVDAVVLYNKQFRDFYVTYYGVSPEKIHVLRHPLFKRETANPVISENPRILFAGRFVKYKNLLLVLQAFDRVRRHTGKGELWLIGFGPEKASLIDFSHTLDSKDSIHFQSSVPQDVLFKFIQDSALCIGPALSEFNPNFILESLSFGKPVLLSSGNGLSVDLPKELVFDQFSLDDLVSKIEYLFDPVHYAQAVQMIGSIEMNRTWDNLLDEHVKLIKTYIR